MSEITIQEIHEQCLLITQQVIEGFGWDSISVGVLSNEDKGRLTRGIESSILNWPWAMVHYRGSAEDGILDISLKIITRGNPDSLHAVIICKYDWRREQFSICMLENFIADEETILTGNVLIIALIYATTFCNIAELDEIFIQDPTPEAEPRYRSYGFAQVFHDHCKMSAEVADIWEMVQTKVQNINQNDE